jgi:hypothetical protein
MDGWMVGPEFKRNCRQISREEPRKTMRNIFVTGIPAVQIVPEISAETLIVHMMAQNSENSLYKH